MSDQLFTTHRYEIAVDKFGDKFGLCVFSDVHHGAYNHDGEKFDAMLRECQALEKSGIKMYYLGLGDYRDAFSTIERRVMTDEGLHDTTRMSLDDWADKGAQEFIKKIEFMRGRLIGMIEGNHHYVYQSGQTDTMKMCEALKCKYLGGISLIRLTFAYTKGGRCASLDIYAHHTSGSKGGGKTQGSSMNAIENMTHTWDADIYLAGHDHKFNFSMPSSMYLDPRMNIKERERMLVRTGSFQKGWMPDNKGYVPTFNGRPNFLGCPLIELRPEVIRASHAGIRTEEIKIKKSVRAGDWF